MELTDTSTVRSFGDDGFGKTNLFETPRFFADVYCFEEGQRQEPHVHENADKVYHVLEGEAEVQVGEEHVTVGEDEAVLAESGKEHGVEARMRSRLLVYMAPHPASTDDADDHGHDHDHGHGTDASFDVGFVTVSSSRGESEDESGETARRIVEDSDHRFAEYRVVSDNEDEIRDAVGALVDETDAVVTSGGTGLTDDDVTVETVRGMLDKEIPGFGEEFRRRSFDDVGTAAMLSRATAGVVDGSAVFVLPGSVGAVETGVPLALSELGHVLSLVRRGS